MILGVSSNKPALVQIRRRSAVEGPDIGFWRTTAVSLGCALRALTVMTSRLGRTAELEPLRPRQAGGPSDELRLDHP
jgi:hypothetical protein